MTESSGLRFEHSFGDRHFSNLAEAVGSGVVVLDYDGDERQDVYLTTGKFVPPISTGEAPPSVPLNRLYRNRGDGTFEDVTERAGVGAPGRFSTGAAAADYDNDGDTDLYVCNYGESQLFRNNGNGTFTDVTKTAGVADPGRFAVTATFVDYDRDGFPDLYVGNYIVFDPKYNLFYAPDGFPGPLAYKGQPDRLYHNRRDGTFEDVSASTGIAQAVGRAMSVVAADYDADGDDDVYVTNDATENFLFRNEGGRRFEQVALLSGVAYNGMGDSTASMAADFGDYDGDGRLDLFVSDNSFSSLYRNEGGIFADVVTTSGIAASNAQFVGWGSFFFDFDNDGDLDIFKVNSDLSRLFGQEHQMLENRGDGTFEDVSDRLGEYFGRELRGRGTAHLDFDDDGDLDVVVANLGSPAVLLRNDGGHRKHWLSVRLAGGARSRDSLGAAVRITAGGRTQVAFRRSASGYLSQNDPRLHFGLGEASVVDRVEVQWPSGRKQALEKVPANHVLVLQEPSA